MAKKKFYAIAKGRTPGIYTSWPQAEAEVKGYSGAQYKSFPTHSEAEIWMNNPQLAGKTTNRKQKTTPPVQPTPVTGNTEIYTDGGAINNPGPGGYGVVILENSTTRELTGGYIHTTNNRMELMACIKGIEALSSRTDPVSLFSDSKYVVNAISKGWAKGWCKRNWLKSDGKPAANTDLWEHLLTITRGLDISFHWVKGHAGHPLNERCDQLAVQSARGDKLVKDQGYKG